MYFSSVYESGVCVCVEGGGVCVGCVKRECIESSECMESMGSAWGDIYIWRICVEGTCMERESACCKCVCGCVERESVCTG